MVVPLAVPSGFVLGRFELFFFPMGQNIVVVECRKVGPACPILLVLSIAHAHFALLSLHSMRKSDYITLKPET